MGTYSIVSRTLLLIGFASDLSAVMFLKIATAGGDTNGILKSRKRKELRLPAGLSACWPASTTESTDASKSIVPDGVNAFRSAATSVQKPLRTGHNDAQPSLIRIQTLRCGVPN